MAPARISVVIPVFNGERFLAEAIESCLGQTLAPAEVIVVDDGSTDGSAGVAESFGPPVRLVGIEHQGVSVARSTGVARSSVDLIAFVDADDLMKPQRLELQVAAMEKQPGLAFVLGRADFRLEDGLEPPEFDAGKLAPIARGRERYWAMTLMATRQAFDRIGPFEPSMQIGQDGDWVMRAFESGLPYALLEEPLIERRYHGGNTTYDTAGTRRASFDVLRRRAARHRAGSD